MTEGSTDTTTPKPPPAAVPSPRETLMAKVRKFFLPKPTPDRDVDPKVDHLADSVLRAKLLLAFASQGGISIDGTSIDAVLAAEKSLKDKSTTPAVEAAFWTALSKLAVAIRPVTVSSLQNTTFVTGSSKVGLFTNPASRVVALVASFTLLAIICVQIQAAMLSSRIQGFDDLVAKGKVSVDAASKLSVEGKNATLERDSVLAGSDPAAKKAAELKLIAAVADWNKAYHDNNATQQARSSAARLLGHAAKFWMTSGSVKSSDPLVEQGPQPGSTFEVAVSAALPIDEYRIRQEAQNQSDILYRLLLPALYGLLGSTIYVIRSLSLQLEDFTFTWTRRLLGSARIVLGPIMGVASLVLIDPKTDGLKNLPPLAIALVAGYSVDLLLSFMDKLTSAFGQPSTSPAQTPPGKP